MRKAFVFFVTTLLFVSFTFAASNTVILQYKKKNNNSSHTSTDRAPETVPVEVTMDSSDLTITVSGDHNLDAEIFLYDGQRVLINYSTDVNVCFQLNSHGVYIIEIDSEYWEASAKMIL